MPSDRHIIAGVEHIATTNPGTPEAPAIKPLDEAADLTKVADRNVAAGLSKPVTRAGGFRQEK
jgi:hypothetical protein